MRQAVVSEENKAKQGRRKGSAVCTRPPKEPKASVQGAPAVDPGLEKAVLESLELNREALTELAKW